MKSFSAFFKGFLLCFLLMVIFCLMLANPQEVSVALDPFSDPSRFIMTKPLYQIIFISFFLGTVVGSVLMWFQQRKYRRMLHTMKKGQFPSDAERVVLASTEKIPSRE